jgi:hypothetical protein
MLDATDERDASRCWSSLCVDGAATAAAAAAKFPHVAEGLGSRVVTVA